MIVRKIVLLSFAVLLALSAAAAAAAVPAAAQGDGPAPKTDSAYCPGAAQKQHPAAARIAAGSGYPYEQVLGWFCQGFGFGQIKKALAVSEMTGEAPDVILAEKRAGGGWGAVWKARGIGGPPPHAKANKVKPGKGPKGKDSSGSDAGGE